VKGPSLTKMDKTDICIYVYLLILAVCSVIYGVVVVVQSDTHGPGLYVNAVLPLDAVTNMAPVVDNLSKLNNATTKSFTVTVWWGRVETIEKSYEWVGYQTLFDAIFAQIPDAKLKINFAFHACQDNTFCDVVVPLPSWIDNYNNENASIYYTDANGNSTKEYLTSGVDHLPIFGGRTAVQMYTSLIQDFLSNFSELLDTHIFEVQVGLGPAGELRYPAFSFEWFAPGIGQFQSYDSYLQKEYTTFATKSGHPEWAFLPHADWLSYNDEPEHALFFNDTKFGNGSTSDYGVFFNQWYANRLIQHGSVILAEVSSIVKTYSPTVTLAGKLGCIYWLSNDETHAAEITAGYYNYTNVAQMFANNGAILDFGCFDLTNKEAKVNFTKNATPENLVHEVFQAVSSVGGSMCLF